ncbi:MAG: ribonuclease R [candidate division Zixibacteria bacterium]|nr:ribonuclease R [candidate division Zixibacteria bacterium]
MNIDEHLIVDFLAYKAGRPLKIKELARALKISPRDYLSFRGLVKRLIDSGQLVKLRRNRLGVPSELNLVLGQVSISKSGYGTILTESGKSITIPPADMLTALDGDKVMVRVEMDAEGKSRGTVIKIIERASRNIIGTFHIGQNFNFVIADNKKVRRDIYIHAKLTKRARDGEKVVVRINQWADTYSNPEGEVVEKIGLPGDPGVDLLTVIKGYQLAEEFPRKVIEEAKTAEDYFNPEEIKQRRNFTDEIIYTIDPSDAKDHDDAVSVMKTSDGYRLGVYIADVSHFVREGTLLDKEAFTRGNSVYLPGKVIPMLPEELSNILCSLRPNCRRLVYATLINFDNDGKMLNWEITEGVIKSCAKLTYEEVQQYLDKGEVIGKIAKVAKSLQIARQLAILLQKRRVAEGSLDFDLPETKIILNKKGEIIEIGNRVRLESHRLIEEFMLAANKVIALHVFRRGQKFLYRVHDKPDLEKLEAFSYLVSTLGYSFPVSENMKPIQFTRFLEKLKGKPEEEFLNELMLRSMKKAVYQSRNIGHFGLAFTHYTHFTSPIRRYPDLIVHRLLKKLKNGRYPDKLNKQLDSILENVGRHCSETERNAEAAEREAIKIKQVAYMANHIGQEYSGIISGILNFGFFVRLGDTGAEGMVRLSSLDDDYYKFETERFRLVGKRTGKIFSLGDKVKVGILSVDRLKNEINLYMIESKSKERHPQGKRRLKS